MLDLAEIREGLDVALTREFRGFNVSGYEVADPLPPVIHCMTAETTYDLAGSLGLHAQRITVQALFSSSDMEVAQRALDDLVNDQGPKSLKGALEADTTLGGVCQDLRVVSCTGQRRYVRENGPSLIGAEWTVEIYT